MKKMIKAISISGLVVITVILVSGCARPAAIPKPAGLPPKTVLSNGIAYHTTWESYNSCWAPEYLNPDALCGVRRVDNTTDGPFIRLQPYIIEALGESNNLSSFCDVVRINDLLPTYNQENACKEFAKQRLLKAGNYDKSYEWGFIDRKTFLLKKGEILQAYQEGLIDKNTADLYLQKQAIDNGTIAAQKQNELVQAQVNAARRAADAAEDAQSYQRARNLSGGLLR